MPTAHTTFTTNTSITTPPATIAAGATVTATAGRCCPHNDTIAAAFDGIPAVSYIMGYEGVQC